MTLLDPRFWLAAVLALAAAFGVGYFKGSRHGAQEVRNEWTAATAAANAEARHLEQARQSAADNAGRLAAAREVGIRADAARARDAVGGLRDAIDAAQRRGEESSAAALHLTRVLGDVLQSCSAEYRSLAEEADRATSEALTLRQAWPR